MQRRGRVMRTMQDMNRRYRAIDVLRRYWRCYAGNDGCTILTPFFLFETHFDRLDWMFDRYLSGIHVAYGIDWLHGIEGGQILFKSERWWRKIEKWNF